MKDNIKKSLTATKSGLPEVIVLLVYIIGTSVISYFHEPWFDEAQAWQIARSASIKDILFTIPHYEGHPQLWYFLLMPFARTGAPYELSLSFVNILFCSLAVFLLLFKSPFPRIVKCYIPFTYFFFYQYAVISRPYSVMMLAFALMAITYVKRNEKPLLYVLSLALLCLTQAFGIVIAGGLCIVWVGEIFIKYYRSERFADIFKCKSMYCLLGLAVLAVALILCIVPAKDVYYKGMDDKFSLRSILEILVIPPDSLFTSYHDEYIKKTVVGLTMTAIIGAVLWFIMIAFAKANKKLATFVVPLMMFLIFGLAVYLSNHHIGICTMFLVFIAWITIADNGRLEIPPLFLKLKKSISSKAIQKAAVFIVLFISIIPLAWTVHSSIADIKYYYFLNPIADFIKDNKLENRKILVSWGVRYTPDKSFNIREHDYSELDDTPYRHDYTYLSGTAASTLPYFDKNIYMNFNVDDPDIMYMQYRQDSDVQKVFKEWHDLGLPDVIVGSCTLSKIYSEEELKDVNYVCVADIVSRNIWKMTVGEPADNKIYIREDLLSEYPDLHEIKY